VSALLDHLVIAAASLEQGVAWCEATMGVTPGAGGKHPLMGTHNRLLKIASPAFPAAYLEIIAIDPDAPAPGRARWFGLDEPALQQRLQAAPCLVHLVARTPDVQGLGAGLRAIGLAPGPVLDASRDTASGRLSWRITVPTDGQPGCGGALPTLIEWQGSHPAAAMADSGLVLTGLQLRGLPQAAQSLLGLPGVHCPAEAGAALTAEFATPLGLRVLASPTLEFTRPTP
jgi:hypothetical protein